MLAFTHAEEKANAISATQKQPQNSSYKVQLLHAAVLLQSGRNRLRSPVAELVAVLQKLTLEIPLRDETATANSAHQKEPQNSSYKIQPLYAAVLLQSGGNCLRSFVARPHLVVVLQKLMLAITLRDERANANSEHN
jgi:hypothetical protein